MPALLALVAACTFGVANFLGGLSTRKAAVVALPSPSPQQPSSTDPLRPSMTGIGWSK